MDAFVAYLPMVFRDYEPIAAAAYVLWKLNWIHPFAQGNGRTARAASYFILCQKYNHWFDGKTVPERIREERNEYCDLLTYTDSTLKPDGTADLIKLTAFLTRLFTQQLSEGA
jgi:Fic family protein